jgi:hypothetical protein
MTLMRGVKNQQRDGRPVRSHPNMGSALQSVRPAPERRTDQRFGWSGLCGAPAGIEPATPSLPWNHQEPLCGPPFPQVAPDRKGQSYRFSFAEVMRSFRHALIISGASHNRPDDHEPRHLSPSNHAIYLHTCTPFMLLHTPSAPHQPDPARLTFPSSRCPPLVPSKSNTRQQCAKARLGRRSDRAGAGSAVGSLALAGTSPSPSRHRCRAPTAPTTGPRFGAQRAVGWSWWSRSLSEMSTVSRSPCPRTRSRPRVRCPVSGVRCDRPVSAYAMSRVGCPMSGRGCPASVSARSASASRCVGIGELVELVGAAGSHMVRRGLDLAVLPYP